ncbi:MAG: carbohydrate ABC transporter substrate-binding protein [Proteobacteria bacterium]|nr:carbohydrate ABC transporter substrate-binding protein [Pseudomonadota bacterium]
MLRGSLAVAAAGAIGRPYIANAQAKTTTVLWVQGFVKEEDEAFKKLVADYEKASGNKIDYSLIPFGPAMQKIVAGLTSGDTPDIMMHDIAEQAVVPQNAWNDKLVELTDVVDTQKAHYHPTALLASEYYNNVTKQRRVYYVPVKTAVLPFHIWGSLVEKAGFKLADAPKTWDAFWDFFKPMQKELRKTIRGIYVHGLQPTTTGPADGNNTFHHFMIANGGNGIVTADGRAHLDDPQIKEAVIKALTYITTSFKEGYVPPGALSWSDADDNNAFHAKQILMDLDGTISPEVSLLSSGKKAEYDDVVTRGLTLDNAGKEMPALLGASGAFIAKTAKNIPVAKEFLKYMIQPKVVNEYLKTGLGRWLPPYPEVVKSDPFWLKEDPHRTAYATEAMLGPTAPNYPSFNPGYAECNAQQIWGIAAADVIKEGMTPQAATDKALKRMASILARYPIASS